MTWVFMENVFPIVLLVLAALAVWGGLFLSKRAPKARRASGKVAVLISAIAVFSVVGGGCSSGAGSSSKTASTSISYKIKHKVIRVGASRLADAKAESSALAASLDELTSESSSVKSASSSLASSASSASSASKARAASSASVAKAASASSASVAKAQAASASRSRSRSRAQASTHRTVKRSTGGDVVTGQGQIIGNKNSKIYHVPGQSGYHMKPANAVYFKTEAAAKAAGYRKALR
jgi:hypothetical protein